MFVCVSCKKPPPSIDLCHTVPPIKPAKADEFEDSMSKRKREMGECANNKRKEREVAHSEKVKV